MFTIIWNEDDDIKRISSIIKDNVNFEGCEK